MLSPVAVLGRVNVRLAGGFYACRAHREPASAARFVALADELTPPSFAAFLHVAVYEGMRPGELDALRWDRIDL